MKLPASFSNFKPKSENEIRLLACGHFSDGNQPDTHDKCKKCYLKFVEEFIISAEAEFDLDAVLVGTPGEIAWARKIRAYKVSALAELYHSGKATQKHLLKLDEFRQRTNAHWFIFNRMFKVKVKS